MAYAHFEHFAKRLSRAIDISRRMIFHRAKRRPHQARHTMEETKHTMEETKPLEIFAHDYNMALKCQKSPRIAEIYQ